MGTRCLTLLPGDGGQEAAVLYRQFDGYPEGHGQELEEFLAPLTEVNGFGSESDPVFNGPSCLSAMLVAHFKSGVGGFYLYPAGTRDCGEEYVYVVQCHGPGTKPTIKTEEV